MVKWSATAGCLGLCQFRFCVSLRMDTLQPLWTESVPVFNHFSRKKVSSLFLNYISCILVCAYCFLPCHWASLRRIWLPLLYSYHQVFIQWIIFQKALSEPGRMVPALLACLHQTDAPRAYSSLWYFTGLASMHICLPFAREPGTGPTSRYVSPGEEKDQLS